MMNSVAAVLGYSDTTARTNYHLSERIRVISESLTKVPGQDGFEDEVNSLEVAFSAQGNAAIAAMVGAITAPPVVQEPKIKCVPKGQRIDMKSESGIKFAFGPKWIESVKSCKGIAMKIQNREKLNMHGLFHKILNPESMSARDLCLAIIHKMEAA